ncbi:TPA: hypothetical protein ACXLCK_001906 [Pseudomonas aeruginosa]
MSKTAPYSWIVRFDVAPEWVADGFVFSDQRALEMLGADLSSACMSTELAAAVLAAPSPLRIAREQGYGKNHPQADVAVAEIVAGTPKAKPGETVLESALVNAIKLLDSVAFVQHENDNTGVVLSELRDALALVQGKDPISNIRWVPTPA